MAIEKKQNKQTHRMLGLGLGALHWWRLFGQHPIGRATRRV